MKQLSPIWLIYSLSFVVSHGIPAVIPLLPLMSNVLDIPPTKLTLLLSSFSIAAMFSTILWGYLIPKVRLSILISTSLALYFFGGILCVFTANLQVFMILRIFQGIGSAGMHILSLVLAAQYYEGQERAKVMGGAFAFVAFGLFSTPILSGYLAKISWETSFVVLQLPTIIPLIIFYFTEKVPHTAKTKEKKTSLNDYKLLFLNKRMFALLIAYIIITGLDLTLPHLLSLYTSDTFGFSAADIGTIYAVGTTGIIFGSAILLKRLSGLKNFPYIIIGYGICVAIAMALLLQVESMSIMAVILFIYFSLSGVLQPYMNYSMSVIAPKELLATAMTLFMITLRFGQGFVPLAFSNLSVAIDYTHTVYIAIACYLLMIALAFYFTRHNKQ